MKKFLKLTFALVALMFGMAACSDEPVQSDVEPAPIQPGAIEAPEFTGVDATAVAAMADGSRTVKLTRNASYTRTLFTGAGTDHPRYIWRNGREDAGIEYMFVRNGRVYVPVHGYGSLYVKEHRPDALSSFNHLYYNWRNTYEGRYFECRPAPLFVCASDFNFRSLPTLTWHGMSVEIPQLNGDSFVYADMSRIETSDVVNYIGYSIAEASDESLQEVIFVESPVEGMRIMLDRCKKVYGDMDVDWLDEWGRELGLL